MEAEPFVRRSAHLRLVTTPPAPVTGRARSGANARMRADEARARVAFLSFMAVFAFAVALGGARVTLIARAAEATVTESRVQAAIKTQMVQADQLEVDKSALSTPARIAGIASTTMGMGEPASVRYISLSATPAGVGTQSTPDAGVAVASRQGTPDVLGGLLGAVMELSAGEAQSLLVGDLGLAGSR
jgi:cell division protein FtsL